MVEMRDIASNLLELTRQNRVPWKATSDKSTYVAVYGDISVIIFSEGTEPGDTVTLGVYDGTGTVIDRTTYYGPGTFLGQPGLPSNEEIKLLYESAKRTALGVDQRLTNLMERMNAVPPATPQ